MIRASLYGRLGGDPAERTTRNNKTMVTASLAVNANRPGDEDVTEWFQLVAFGRQGESLLRHVKGEPLAVMGPLQRTQYSDREGQPRESWSLVVESLVSARSVRPKGGQKRQPDQPAPTQETSGHEFDDSIPF